MSTLIERAFALALDLHRLQRRKASIVPDAAYMGHLTEVAGMAWSCFAVDDPTAETVVAAALLHDAIEDQPMEYPRSRIAAECSRAVLELVLELTESGTGGLEKAPWHDRKVAYLSHIQELSTSALLISVCDKLQSARELKRQVRLKGIDAYEAFRGAGEDKWEREHNVFWFHCELSKAFHARLSVISRDLKGPIIKAIQALIDEFDDIVGWLDR